MRRKFLVVSENEAALKFYLKLAIGLSCFDFYFYLDERDGYTGFDNIHFLKKGNGGRFKVGNLKKIKGLIKKVADDTVFGCFIQSKLLLIFLSIKKKSKILSQSEIFEGIIKREGISSVIVSSDRNLGLEISVCYASKKLNKKINLISFAYSANVESCLTLRTNKVYKIFNQLCVDENLIKKGRDSYSFYRPYETLALWKLGLLPKRPWSYGGGISDVVFMENDREIKRVNGTGDNKYISIGSPEISSLLSVNRTITTDGREVLVALPQYYEHGFLSWEEHIKFVDGFFESLPTDIEVVVSLHPKANPLAYKYLEGNYNVVLSTEGAASLMPNCDYFVSSYSSTIMAALLLGKKIVIIDYLKARYKDFYDEFEIPVFENNQDIGNYIKETIGNSGVNYIGEYAEKLKPTIKGDFYKNIQSMLK